MDIQTRKLHFIREILAVKSEHTITALENLLKREKQKDRKKKSIYNLVGVISEEEAQKMKEEIEAACENIQDEDWK